MIASRIISRSNSKPTKQYEHFVRWPPLFLFQTEMKCRGSENTENQYEKSCEADTEENGETNINPTATSSTLSENTKSTNPSHALLAFRGTAVKPSRLSFSWSPPPASWSWLSDWVFGGAMTFALRCLCYFSTKMRKPQRKREK